MYKRAIGVWTLAAVLFAWTGPADAGGIVKRTDTAIFSTLAVGQSARAVGMGSAYTTVGADVDAIWWNPAGLSGIERAEASFSRSRWFVESTFNSGAVAVARGVHAFGVSFMAFDPGTVEERTILRPEGTGRNLSLGTVAISAAYARKFTDKLSFGVRFMWARENLDLTEYSTFNVDFGTLFHTGFQNLRLSMAMRNFGTDTEVQRRKFQQPLTFNLGAAAEIYAEKEDPFYVTASFEMTFTINYKPMSQ